VENQKQFARQLKAVWTIDGGLVKKDEISKNNEILALLFENNSPFFSTPDNSDGTATLLFCEGRTNSMGELVPCGMAGYSEFDYLEATPRRVDLFSTVKVCQCSAPETQFEQSSQSCTDIATGFPNLIPPDCNTVTRAHFLLHVLPGVSYDDGVPMAATMTEHDPIDCNKVSGSLHDICLNDGLSLDYRCQAILIFDEQENFLGFSRSIGGSYIISRPVEGQ